MSRRDLENKSLKEVADFMAGVTQGSLNDQAAKAEFLFRQTDYQREATECQRAATEHQRTAADAAQRTALYTQKYTRYMFWSVVVLTMSSIATVIISIFEYFKK